MRSVANLQKLNIKDEVGEARDDGGHTASTVPIVVGDVQHSPLSYRHQRDTYYVPSGYFGCYEKVQI